VSKICINHYIEISHARIVDVILSYVREFNPTQAYSPLLILGFVVVKNAELRNK